MTKPRAIIVDLDSTLCNNDHRQHHLEGEKKNWKAFNAACIDDTPNEWCVNLVLAMKAAHYEVVFISGRSQDYHNETMWWIEKHLKFGPLDYCRYLRAAGDFRPDGVVKVELYRQFVEPHLDVLFCVDDRKSMVQAWREAGLVCLDCKGGEY